MKRKSNETTTRHFRGNPDYKAAFSAAVTDLIASNRANPIPRAERMRLIGALIDEYIASTGERPDAAELERLADAVLYEELTDTNRMKSRDEEYPILSEHQLARRQSGKYKRWDTEGEVPLEVALHYATDGHNYCFPNRRRRTIEEMIWMDWHSRSRNKDRRDHYNAFIAGKHSYVAEHVDKIDLRLEDGTEVDVEIIEKEVAPIRYLEYGGKTYKNIKISP
jgi:hypothetical protein